MDVGSRSTFSRRKRFSHNTRGSSELDAYLTARGAFSSFLPKVAILGVICILGPASFNSPGSSFLPLEARGCPLTSSGPVARKRITTHCARVYWRMETLADSVKA